VLHPFLSLLPLFACAVSMHLLLINMTPGHVLFQCTLCRYDDPNEASHTTHEVLRYTPTTDTWEACAPLCGPRYGAHFAVASRYDDIGTHACLARSHVQHTCDPTITCVCSLSAFSHHCHHKFHHHTEGMALRW
jgi:hypothetical protein